MRRRLGALLTAVLVGSVLAALAPAQPAGAHSENVCAGQGTASIALPGLFYPGLGTTTSTSGTGGGSLTLHTLPKLLAFSFAATAGGFICAPNADFNSAGGLVSGWCGHSWGSGSTNLGQRFNWVSIGGKLIVTGMLLGVVNAIPNVLAGESCATGALSFLAQGAVATIHECNIFKNKLSTLLLSFPDPLFHTLTTVGGATTVHLTIAGGNYHIWHKLCIHV